MALALIFPPTSNILRPFYWKLLLKLGINWNILTELVEISIYMGEFQMKSLEIEQYIESIELIISYFSSILSTSNLMKHSLEHIQLEVGWDKPIFTSSYS